jgi:multimeric flavodoxin WrbA
MKVLLINGSPHEKGCTYTALSEVAKEIENGGIETEIFHIGKKPIAGCIVCGHCYKTGKCVFDDVVNVGIEKAKAADGLIVGSPVYYGSASGQITSFLDRLFFATNNDFQYKPGASVLSCSRGGATAAFEQLNKYFTISNMPLVSSCYWNMVHGNTPDEVKQDVFGMRVMKKLGENMVWMLKSLQAGKYSDVIQPKPWYSDRIFKIDIP